MTQSSAAPEFIEQFRRSAASAGAIVRCSNDAISLERCGVAELSLLLAELRDTGYCIIASKPTSNGVRLGVMHTSASIPEFFAVELASSSIQWPATDGLFLAFLGPDGVGKTTTVDRVMGRLKPIFGEQHLFHWRPQVIKPRTKDDERGKDDGWMSINRHGDPPRGKLLSVIRLAGVFADYLVGNRRFIRPALRRGGLVVFDRYYHDILVDSKRYRYGGPQWLLPAMRALLPRHRVIHVVLDADARVILSRKQEVSPEELLLQRKRYAALARSLHGIYVRTDFGPDQTLSEVLRGIGQHLTHRFDEKLHCIECRAVTPASPKHPVTVAKTA